MKRRQFALMALLFPVLPLQADEPKEAVKETEIAAPHDMTIRVRMQGPYDMETQLQIVCYFKHGPEEDTTLGAAVELDKRLGGVIASLRDRHEFVGEALETLLLTPPRGTIAAKQLLLIGLGDEKSLSLERMEAVGRVAMREAIHLKASHMAFAPLLRDQGNDKFPTGDVAQAVLKGAILAFDMEMRLQNEGLSKPFSVEEWIQEAGPKYYDETVIGVQKAVDEGKAAIAKRGTQPYTTSKK